MPQYWKEGKLPGTLAAIRSCALDAIPATSDEPLVATGMPGSRQGGSTRGEASLDCVSILGIDDLQKLRARRRSRLVEYHPEARTAPSEA